MGLIESRATMVPIRGSRACMAISRAAYCQDRAADLGAPVALVGQRRRMSRPSIGSLLQAKGRKQQAATTPMERELQDWAERQALARVMSHWGRFGRRQVRKELPPRRYPSRLHHGC